MEKNVNFTVWRAGGPPFTSAILSHLCHSLWSGKGLEASSLLPLPPSSCLVRENIRQGQGEGQSANHPPSLLLNGPRSLKAKKTEDPSQMGGDRTATCEQGGPGLEDKRDISGKPDGIRITPLV